MNKNKITGNHRKQEIRSKECNRKLFLRNKYFQSIQRIIIWLKQMIFIFIV